MDPERWPESVRKFVEQVTCPRCGTPKAQGVMVTVRYRAPLWAIVANCFRCHLVYAWNAFDDGSGAMSPVPDVGRQPAKVINEDAGVTAPVAVPEWLKQL